MDFELLTASSGDYSTKRSYTVLDGSGPLFGIVMVWLYYHRQVCSLLDEIRSHKSIHAGRRPVLELLRTLGL